MGHGGPRPGHSSLLRLLQSQEWTFPSHEQGRGDLVEEEVAGSSTGRQWDTLGRAFAFARKPQLGGQKGDISVAEMQSFCLAVCVSPLLAQCPAHTSGALLGGRLFQPGPLPRSQAGYGDFAGDFVGDIACRCTAGTRLRSGGAPGVGCGPGHGRRGLGGGDVSPCRNSCSPRTSARPQEQRGRGG